MATHALHPGVVVNNEDTTDIDEILTAILKELRTLSLHLRGRLGISVSKPLMI